MDFNIFLQADQAAFEFEKAKRALEAAKAAVETTKQTYEDVMSRAEESGVSKSKFKKIIEERVTSLFENGFAESAGTAAFAKNAAARGERLKKPKKPDSATESERGATDTLASKSMSATTPSSEDSYDEGIEGHDENHFDADVELSDH